MNGAPVEISTLIGLGGLMLTLVALTGGVLYRLGVLTNRVDQLDRRFEQQAEENRETREELRREMRETHEEFRQEFRDAREEFRQEMRETREENRRNHQQLLQGLAHHYHDSDTGFAIFRIPPGTENPAV